jgi:drug/metabolite transporter (DMT)-like permease
MTVIAGRLAASSRAEALKGHGAMLAFAVIISGSFSLGHLAAPHLAPSALNAARFGVALVALGLAAALGPGLRREHLRAPWRYLALGSLLAVYFVLMFEALRLTDPVSTAAVFTLTPLMSAGFGRLVAGQRVGAGVIGALALGGIGALWVIFRADLDALLALRLGAGERLFLIGCAAHALYTPMVRRLNRGEPPLAFAFWTSAACGLTILGLALTDGSLAGVDWAALPRVAVWAILYLAVMATATTAVLVQVAALRLPAGKAMAYGYLVPSFVIVWEGLAGHGWAAPAVLGGVALTVAAMLLLVWR